jgi:hypothetical protein
MSSIVISGDTSGSVTLQAPAIAGSTVVTLPTTSMNIGTGGGSVATNTAFGASALNANTTGANNVAVGYLASDGNTTGIQNVAIGSLALRANTTAGQSVAVGYQAARLQTGGANVAVGFNSLLGSAGVSTGTSNTAIGTQALLANTTASNNTAVGYQAGYSVSTNPEVTAIGYRALYATTVGYTTAVGSNALQANTTGTFNVALGREAGYSNTTGSNNTFIGYQALTSNTTGNNNVAVGHQAGNSVTTGGDNTLIGFQAGQYSTALTTGDANTIVGAYSYTAAATNSGSIVIGRFIAGKGTNTGIISPSGGGGMYQGNNSASWSTTSDQRLKKNIVDNTDGLSKIASIRVRNFEYRLPEEVSDLPQNQAIAQTGVQLGVIAQELQQVLPECVKTESTGVMSVDTDNLTWYLVNAIQEQQALITTLTTRITALEAKVGA